MKCAIYARVSTEEQAKNYSIPAQLDLLRGFARTNNYEEMSGIYFRGSPKILVGVKLSYGEKQWMTI
jgi:DNA invertase Pin-like site-specific DNA recombinase